MLQFITAGLVVFSMSSVAIASEFDGFVGTYKVTSAPEVTPVNSNYCNRFGFKEIVGLDVVADPGGSLGRTHVVYIQNPNGWSGYPTDNYASESEMGNGGTYAKTTGTSDSASNEHVWWTKNPDQKEVLSITLQKSGDGFIFSMYEANYKENVVSSSCSYKVELSK